MAEMMAVANNSRRRATPEACMARALASLEGLSCGDAFGECFFDPRNRAVEIRASRILPPGPGALPMTP